MNRRDFQSSVKRSKDWNYFFFSGRDATSSCAFRYSMLEVFLCDGIADLRKILMTDFGISCYRCNFRCQNVTVILDNLETRKRNSSDGVWIRCFSYFCITFLTYVLSLSLSLSLFLSTIILRFVIFRAYSMFRSAAPISHFPSFSREHGFPRVRQLSPFFSVFRYILPRPKDEG